MSTRALICYKTESAYVCKYSHYGAWQDYRRQLGKSSFKDFFRSVNQGDSSEPFCGFYNDFEHCKTLGWDIDMFVENLKVIAPRVLTSLDEVKKCADDLGVDMIYIKHQNGLLEILEYSEHGYQTMIDEDNYVIEPFIIENLDSYSAEDIYEEIYHALCELDDVAYNLNCEYEFAVKLDELNLNNDKLSKTSSKEELIEFCKRFNNSIDELTKFFKEAQ